MCPPSSAVRWFQRSGNIEARTCMLRKCQIWSGGQSSQIPRSLLHVAPSIPDSSFNSRAAASFTDSPGSTVPFTSCTPASGCLNRSTSVPDAPLRRTTGTAFGVFIGGGVASGPRLRGLTFELIRVRRPQAVARRLERRVRFQRCQFQRQGDCSPKLLILSR